MLARRPRLSGEVRVVEAADALYDELGRHLLAASLEAVKARGVFHLALSGGSTPQPFYFRLITDPPYRFLPWKQTHLWLVDERRVPDGDQRLNFTLIREMVADHVPTPRRQVHPIAALDADPAGRYESELRRAFEVGPAEPRPVRLDYVLLGMGPDGHTASLFPRSPAQSERSRWVAVNDGPTVTPPPRVTLTYPLLNAARTLVVLVTGAAKAPVIARVEAQLADAGPDPQALPITGIDPQAAGGTLTWFLDGPAASTGR